MGDVAEGGAQQRAGQQRTQQLRENVAGHPAPMEVVAQRERDGDDGVQVCPDTAPMNKMTVSTVKAGAVISAIRPIWPDMPSVEYTITAKLQQDPSVDTVLALGAPFALAAVQSVKNAGSSAKVATFDTNAALVDAIKNGDVQWAVDQQPFLQGYLSVDSLWLYLNNGNVIGGGQPTLTGPSFIDKSNVEAVAEYAKNGTRS